MTLRPIAIAAVLFAAASAQAALVTTSYDSAPASATFSGPDWSIPGFAPGDSVTYSFTFDSGFLDPYSALIYFNLPVEFSVAAGSLTVSTEGTLEGEYFGVGNPAPGFYYTFTPTGATTIMGSILTPSGLVDAAAGVGAVDIVATEGASVTPGEFLYGSGFGGFESEWGYLEISLDFELDGHELSVVADGIRPVPEPSTYGLLGAGILLAAVVARRRLLRR